MGLESVTYISDLNTAWPVGASDLKQQGDDHLRAIKLAIKNTFPSITGAVTLTHAQLNDAALKGAENVFTGATQTLSSVRPSWRFTETDAAANAGKWNLEAQSGQLILETLSDGGASGTTLLRSVRSGNAATLELGGTTITLNGINATDFARLSQANVFTSAVQKVTAAGAAQWRVRDSGAAADRKVGELASIGGTITIRALDDAETGLVRAPLTYHFATDVTDLAGAFVTVNGQDVRNTALFTGGTLGLARGGTGQTTQLGITREVTKAWTIQSDPGGTPSGTAGDVFAYY